MIINKVLLFPSPKGNVTDNEISQIEQTLDSFCVAHERFDASIDQDFDAIIALGGDGTMLNAARLAFRKKTPIRCINFGTLGYMSRLVNSELSRLSKLKSGFETEERMLIDVKVIRNNEIAAESTSLNEAVVARKTDGDIAEISLMCDGAKVCD